ncbi:MAG: hypothetical protein GTN62_10235 [Gemmatimonadales bacterium]|nr:hypothetical protein [Gemmatimonadales bacterium]NIN50474.1 hypothetical protein [Gemmatimonadales bacterium]NIP07938.1 hypothetical protein [Gemmatimonadales bacterium]NIS64810.1 hypothetical protein [Gemmatimonadales bacterium]
MRRIGLVFLFGGLLAAASTAVSVSAQEPAVPPSDSITAPEAVIRELYGLVSWEPGSPPNWDDVRALFHDQAVIVLRTGANATSVFDVDGFVNDFIRFAERPNVQQSGFSETILRIHTTVIRDMAQVWVRYAAHIPGSPRPPQEGVDFFLMIRQPEGWKVAAVTNEALIPPEQLPAVLRD